MESVYITFCTEWAKPISLKGTKQQTQVNKRPEMNKSTGRLISVIATCWEKGSWEGCGMNSLWWTSSKHTWRMDDRSGGSSFPLQIHWMIQYYYYHYIIKWIWEWNLKRTPKFSQNNTKRQRMNAQCWLDVTGGHRLTGCRITSLQSLSPISF